MYNFTYHETFFLFDRVHCGKMPWKCWCVQSRTPPHWSAHLTLIFLAVMELGIFQQTLPGPTLNFQMDLSSCSEDVKLAHDAIKELPWHRPHGCQVLTVCTCIHVHRTPHILFTGFFYLHHMFFVFLEFWKHLQLLELIHMCCALKNRGFVHLHLCQWFILYKHYLSTVSVL